MNELVATGSKDGLAAEARSWASRGRDLQIVDAQTCVNASHFLRSIKGLRAEIAAWFAPHIEAAMDTKRKADAARKGLVDEKERMEAPLVEAEAIVKRGLLQWETKQEELRRDEERRLQAEAQRRAEEQTIAAAAALEMEAASTGNAEMRQEAQDILDQPIDTPVVSVSKFMPKVEGVTYRDNWKVHEDINVRALAAAVANGSVPVTFLTPTMAALNSFARATKGTQAVPGVRFWNDRQIAARG